MNVINLTSTNPQISEFTIFRSLESRRVCRQRGARSSALQEPATGMTCQSLRKLGRG